MHNKKTIIRTFLLITTILLTSCSMNHNQYNSLSVGAILNHTEKLADFDSPYTLCVKNEDETYSFFIFASPIQYKEEQNYIIIDNGIVDSKKEEYAYENKCNKIKTYFPLSIENGFLVEQSVNKMKIMPGFDLDSFSPGKKVIYHNLYGDPIQAIIYEGAMIDLYAYPSKMGINFEIAAKSSGNLSAYNFNIEYKSGFFYKKQDYTYIEQWNNIVGIIYSPIIKHDQNIELCANEAINQVDKNSTIIKYDYQLETDDLVEFSCNLYQNKMPDTAVYSNDERNSFLANYCFVGESGLKGEGIQYARMRLNYFISINPDNILKATYNIRRLSGAETITLYEGMEQWSSTQMTWSSRKEPGDIISHNEHLNSGWEVFDISDYVKKCFTYGGWEKESIGIMLQEEKDYSILATSDNPLYAPYIQLELKEIPAYFECRANINENIL